MGAAFFIPTDPVLLALVAVVFTTTIYFAVQYQKGQGENVSGGLILRRDVNSTQASDSKVLHPSKWKELKVVAVTEVSPNVRLLRISLPQPTDTLELPIGRHVCLLAELPSGRVVRPYTPISAPWTEGYVELLIKFYDHGLMSSHVCSLQPGDTVQMRGPIGSLNWVPSALPRVVLIAGGTGITPMLQLMRCILGARNEAGDRTAVDLLFQNRTLGDLLLRHDIDACVSSRPDSFAAQYFLSSPPPGWGTGGALVPHRRSSPQTQVEGYITAQHVADVLARGPGTVAKVFVCGPSAFGRAMVALVQAAGINEDDIKVF